MIIYFSIQLRDLHLLTIPLHLSVKVLCQLCSIYMYHSIAIFFFEQNTRSQKKWKMVIRSKYPVYFEGSMLSIIW